jgi:hypothetical protein
MARRPDGWQGTEISDLQTVLNLLEALMNSGIPVQKHHYNEVILSNKMHPTLKLGYNGNSWFGSKRHHFFFLFFWAIIYKPIG